jgi:transposase InsO family protein
VDWAPNQIWCWDASQFPVCEAAKYAHGIVDVVSKKWVAVTLTPNPDAIAAKVLFTNALQAEGLWDHDIAARVAAVADGEDLPDDDDRIPLLMALSDNGTEMKAGDTRRFMAACAVVARYGRRSTPTDQAWIESLWGHVKAEWPHLLSIDDPAVLAAELERVRVHYNGTRLHEGIGYVTPDDEHTGRAEPIRQARKVGLTTADQNRRNHRRNPNK